MAQISSNSGAKVTDLGTFHQLYQSEGLRSESIKVARGYFPHSGDVDQIATDAFIKLSKRVLSGQTTIDRKKVKGFIARTTARLCIDELRARKRRPNMFSLDSVTGYGRKAGIGQTHLDNISYGNDWSLQVESSVIANTCISKLPETFRELTRDVFLNGVSYADAAVIHNIPITTVRSRIHRSKKKLREILKKELGL